jgi:hypothetical protein
MTAAIGAGRWRAGPTRAVRARRQREFIRRILLDAVPRGLVRVRDHGLLANGIKSQRLALCQCSLSAPCAPKPTRGDKPS